MISKTVCGRDARRTEASLQSNLGGRYNVIIQASPLEGFDESFKSPSSRNSTACLEPFEVCRGPEGALGRVEPSTKNEPLLYIVALQHWHAASVLRWWAKKGPRTSRKTSCTGSSRSTW